MIINIVGFIVLLFLKNLSRLFSLSPFFSFLAFGLTTVFMIPFYLLLAFSYNPFCYFNLCYTVYSTHLWLIPIYLHMVLYHFIRSHNVYRPSNNTGVRGTDLLCSWKSVYNLQSTLHMWFPHIHGLNQPQITQHYNTAGKNLHVSRPMQFKLVLFKGQLSFIVPLSTCGPKPCILLLHVFNFHGEKRENVSC